MADCLIGGRPKLTFVTALTEEGLMSANDNRGKLAEAWAESGLAQLFEMSQVAEEMAVSPPPPPPPLPRQNECVSLCTLFAVWQICLIVFYMPMRWLRLLLPLCGKQSLNVCLTFASSFDRGMPWSGLPLSHQLTSEPVAERSSEDLNEGIKRGMHWRREGGQGCGGNEWEWMTRGFQYNVIKTGGDKGWWTVRRQRTA